MIIPVPHRLVPPPNTIWLIKVTGSPDELLFVEDFIEEHYAGYKPQFLRTYDESLHIEMIWNSQVIADLLEVEIQDKVDKIVINKKQEGPTCQELT